MCDIFTNDICTLFNGVVLCVVLSTTATRQAAHILLTTQPHARAHATPKHHVTLAVGSGDVCALAAAALAALRVKAPSKLCVKAWCSALLRRCCAAFALPLHPTVVVLASTTCEHSRSGVRGQEMGTNTACEAVAACGASERSGRVKRAARAPGLSRKHV